MVMMRQVLHDPDLQRELLEVGYVKVQLLDAAQIAALASELDLLRPDDGFAPDGRTGHNRSTYHCTFLDANVEYKRKAQELITAVFQPRIDEVVVDYRILTGNFYVKMPGTGRFQIHQNWPTTEDLSVTTLTVWCPLQDCDEINGTLRVVPRSHKLLPDVATPQRAPFFAEFEDELIERHLVPISVKAGEALIFDDSLLHWSSENLSDLPRRAVQIETLPAEVTPVLYHLDETAPVPRWDIYEVDWSFFVDHSIDQVMTRPETLNRISTGAFRNRSVTIDEFEALLAQGAEIRSQVYAGHGWDAVSPTAPVAGDSSPRPARSANTAIVPPSCRGLLVVDRSGLAHAALDQTELRLVSVSDVVELAGGLLDPPTVGTAPNGTIERVESVVPSVLRIDPGAVHSWAEISSSYVPLGRSHLIVLELCRYGLERHELEVRFSELGGGADLASTVFDLERLGLVTVLRSAASPPEIEPSQNSPEESTEPEVPREPSSHEPHLLEGLPTTPSAAARVVVYRVAVRAPRSVRRAARSAVFRGRELIAARLDPSARPTSETGEDRSAGPTTDSSIDQESGVVDQSDALDTSVDSTFVEEEGDFVEHEHEAEVATVPTGPAWSDHRTPVFGVYYSPEHNANLGLGLVIAFARVADGGALNVDFDLRRASIDSEPMLAELRATGRSAVVLFSDFMWSIDHNLEVSAAVKAANPLSVTVHGGPHAPSYPDDAAAFLAANPHVDVLVRGEGEVAIAELLRALGPTADPACLDDSLSTVAGLTYRRWSSSGDTYEVVRTADRERASDMAQFPSPYLTGEFADIDPERWRSATVETNRGCPYGCTFCDWGQATMSRIRQFPLDRVFAELEWIASRGIPEVFLADANFGIGSRDVEVAQHIADLHRRYGAPQQVICSFAKNTVKHTTEIVRIWVEAGICAEGSVALQTTDPVTLENVARSNIRIEKYDALTEEFRRHRLPIVTDLLMGLPGATVESFKTDLQRCLDQDVTPRMMETVVLPNSPMNDPAYRERFGIETDGADIVVSTSSYTREDFEEMKRLRLLFRAFEHFGLLRHLFRWLKVERGINALDLIHDIDRAIIADPHRYPLLTWVGRYFDLVTAPPVGWPPFYAEVADLLADRHGLHGDPGFETVIRVQEFLMPARGRRFPAVIELDHDFVGWLDHHRSSGVPRALTSFGPSRLSVDDPVGVCEERLVRNGFSIRREEACDNPFWVLNDWELDSVLARPMAAAVPFLSKS